MQEYLLIGKKHIFCTSVALGKHAPHLLPKMKEIASYKPLITFIEKKQGESADDEYIMPLDIKDTTEILNALLKIECEQGYNAKFHIMQINFLVLVWKEHVKHLQSKLDKQIPNG
jgi:hypothetical protein